MVSFQRQRMAYWRIKPDREQLGLISPGLTARGNRLAFSEILAYTAILNFLQTKNGLRSAAHHNRAWISGCTTWPVASQLVSPLARELPERRSGPPTGAVSFSPQLVKGIMICIRNPPAELVLKKCWSKTILKKFL